MVSACPPSSAGREADSSQQQLLKSTRRFLSGKGEGQGGLRGSGSKAPKALRQLSTKPALEGVASISPFILGLDTMLQASRKIPQVLG